MQTAPLLLYGALQKGPFFHPDMVWLCRQLCQVSLGSYPEAGILSGGCAWAPAALWGQGQGLQVSIVDVVLLLAALLQKCTQMGNDTTRKVLQKYP